MLRTPNGVIDVSVIQKRACEQIKHFVVSNEIAMAVGLLGTMIEEMEALLKQRDDLLETTTY